MPGHLGIVGLTMMTLRSFLLERNSDPKCLAVGRSYIPTHLLYFSLNNTPCLSL